MDYANVFAYFGGTLLAINMIPQIQKIINTKKVEDVSEITLIMNILGLSCYMFYGIINVLYELVIPICISLILTILTLYLKMYYQIPKHLRNVEYIIEDGLTPVSS
tara:strand:- start:3641 stop:3958 length:318 start_codon:yes stop_codon:yes gene_type:complete